MKILITGITGFIGGAVCKELLQNDEHSIVALIRPTTEKGRYLKFEEEGVTCKLVEMTDENEIKRVFDEFHFDLVFHIAAIRGGRDFPENDYFNANVNATKFIANQCVKFNSKLIFCSSVGVFGAIPKELPPHESTLRQEDNYYHYTKIQAEEELQNLKSAGLNFVIIRPSITYGIGDFGFPHNLIKLVDSGLMLLPTRDIKINMADSKTIVQAFVNAAYADVSPGSAYNIADKNPVSLKKLVNFISLSLKRKKYPKWKICPSFKFHFFEFFFSKIFKNELWKARVQLISRSWFYNVSPAEKELKLKTHDTIPAFKYVIDWYRQTKKGN